MNMSKKSHKGPSLVPNPEIIVQVVDDTCAIFYAFPCKSLAEAEAIKFGLEEGFQICSNTSYDVIIKQ